MTVKCYGWCISLAVCMALFVLDFFLEIFYVLRPADSNGRGFPGPSLLLRIRSNRKPLLQELTATLPAVDAFFEVLAS